LQDTRAYGFLRDRSGGRIDGPSDGARWRSARTLRLPHCRQTSRLVSVTRDVPGSIPKAVSSSSDTDDRWPQLKQAISIRVDTRHTYGRNKRF